MTADALPPCALETLGVACALGRSVDEIWPRLVAGDISGMAPCESLLSGHTSPVGAVPGGLPEVRAEHRYFACRNNQLALLAYAQIAESVDRAIRRFGAARIGVVAGTSTAGIAEAEAAFRDLATAGRLTDSFRLAQLEHGGLADHLTRVSGARGPSFTISTACSSGAKALASARSLIALGLCDAVVAGAVDSLCQLTANGFASLQALSAGLTNPMSRNRDGISLGEGAALFLVTGEGGPIELIGAGESSDAHHMSAPEPSGAGMEACIRAALSDAGLGADEIAYLNLHGTGTPQNDLVESAVVARVFEGGVACSSTKPLVGHALGASGALEAAFCWMMLACREAGSMSLPPHRWDGERDPALPTLSLVEPGARVRTAERTAVMSNSFGFGGSNCSLVLRGGDA